MKHSEAAEITKRLLVASQKFKSNTRETLHGISDKVANAMLADMYPWLFSEDKNVMPALIKMVDRIDDGEQITPQEFYNIMTIYDRFLPDVTVAISLAYDLHLPKPDIHWILGWEEK